MKPSRRQTIGLCVFYCMLHTVLATQVIMHYYDKFTRIAGVGFYTLFTRNFHVSGYDPYTLIVLSNGQICFDVSRHPLLYPLLWPLQQLNSLLINITGINCAIFIMAIVNVASATAAALFLFRMLRYCLRMPLLDSHLLTLFCFSSAHIMLSAMVPDHFAISLCLLTYTMYRTAWLMSRQQSLGKVEALFLFLLTAGVTLTNGVKTALAMLFVHRSADNSIYIIRSATNIVKLLVTASLILFLIFLVQDRTILAEQRAKAHRIEQTLAEKQPERMKRLQHQEAFRRQQNGQALTDSNCMLRFSDISTPRILSLWHNVFGETFILHREHLLEDVQRERPVFVAYHSHLIYLVELLVILFFIVGFALGLRQPIMRMLALWLTSDVLIHIGFGFALNEVYIMAAHWLFIVPVAISFFVRRYHFARLFYIILPFIFYHNVALLLHYFH